jgi:molybdate transport system regulatory protein
MSISIETRIWIEKDGRPFLGSGRIKLLEAIEQEGSISKAAILMKMSYKKAWQLVKSMNTLSDEPIVDKETGGKNGGGTKLTKKGKGLIQEFKKLESKSHSFLEKELSNCCIE